jgi:uncharacterized DUF497 family protein
MIIVWDEPKRHQNLAKHGLDFADLDLSFFLNASIRTAKSGRAIAIGEFKGRVIVAVVVCRWDAKRSPSSPCVRQAGRKGARHEV